MEGKIMKKIGTPLKIWYFWRAGNLMSILCAIALIICLPFTAAAEKEREGGILRQGIECSHQNIIVKLLGVTNYELTEIFNDLLIKTPGVVDAKRYRLCLEPDKPLACIVEWQVRLENDDAFQLETRLYRQVRDLAEKKIEAHTLNFSFKPTEDDLALLNHIRPWRASVREIQFVMNRSLPVIPKGRTPFPESGCWQVWPNAGFE
jgi:signal transduction protein with GAF and PtsI domain